MAPYNYLEGIEVSSSASDNGPPTDNESESDDGTTSDIIKSQVRLQLSAQKSSGSFAVSGILPNAVNPGLSVQGIGTIGLPLSDRDAKALIGASHQAPYGMGTETVVDTAVRKTWELNKDQIKIRNPAWRGLLDTVLKNVSKGLGIVAGAIDCRLYKMLLYEEGAMFKPHKDSEKEDRMFGTLVVSLPSKHNGGAVVVKHDGETQVLYTDKTSEFDVSYLAWYADVTHEVQPVTSGYRLVLTYNLIYTLPGPLQTATTVTDETTKLRNTLAYWRKSYNDFEDCPGMLAYILKHRYTDANLGWKSLKGRDQVNMRSLMDACGKENFCVYLANLEKSVGGACDEYGGDFHDIEEVYDEDLYMTKVLDINDSVVGTRMKIEEEDIVQIKPFDRDPDDEDYSGFTGNEGVTTTHFYRYTVALMMLKSYRLEFMFEEAKSGRVDVKPWIASLIEEVEVDPASERKEELSKLCDLVIAANLPRRESVQLQPCFRKYEDLFSDEVMGMIVKASFLLLRPKLLQEAISSLDTKLPVWTYFEIGKGLHRLPEFSTVEKGITASLGRLSYFHERHTALTSILSGLNAAERGGQSTRQTNIKEWVEHSTMQALESTTTSGKEDGEALVDIIGIFGPGPVFTKALAFAKKNISDTTFAIAFAAALLKSAEQGVVVEEIASDVFREILPDLIGTFTLQPRTIPNKKQRTDNRMRWQPREPDAVPIRVEGETIAYVLGRCMALGLTTELDQLLGKFEKEATTTSGDDLDNIVIPFLNKMLDVYERQNQQSLLPTDRFRRFVHHLLSCYVKNYVQMEPAPPRDWRRSRKGCGCSDCQSLDRFLIDPRQEVEHFAMAEKRRKHLEYKLGAPMQEDYILSVIRKGSPHTLEVRKTVREWQRLHEKWKKRCHKASGQIRGLDCNNGRLKGILNAARPESQGVREDGDPYEDLVQMRLVKLPPQDGEVAGSTSSSTGRDGQRSNTSVLSDLHNRQASKQPNNARPLLGKRTIIELD